MSDNTKGYFHVSHYPNTDSPSDIGFSPLNNEEIIPETQEQLKFDIEEFISVLNDVCLTSSKEFKYFYDRAYYAAIIGLEGDSVKELSSERILLELKKELVSKIGVSIRNSILEKYGRIAFFTSIIFFILGYVISIYHFDNTQLVSHVCIVVSGGVCGSWLSLAIRTKSFSFGDIRLQINNYSSPRLRITFIVVLSFCMALFLESGVMSVEIGNLTSKSIASSSVNSFVLGIFFGLFEKVLVSKIEAKSESFFKS